MAIAVQMTSGSTQNFATLIRSLKIHSLLLVPGLLLLTSCGASLDTQKIAVTIQDDVIKQGGLSLKEVRCPEKITPAVGQAFECVGVLDGGGIFAISVNQQDTQGRVQWQISSVRGLLNVPELQTAVQQEIQKDKDIGQATVDCGRTTYRPTKPGETFECKLLKRGEPTTKSSEKSGDQLQDTAKLETSTSKTIAANQIRTTSAKPPNNPETILITIDTTGNANWQRVLPGASQRGSTPKSPAATTKSEAATKLTPGKPQTTTTNIPDPNRPSDSEVVVD